MSTFQNLPWGVLVAFILNRWPILFQTILVVAWFADISRGKGYFTAQNIKKKKSSNYILHTVMNLFLCALTKQLTFNIPKELYSFCILLEGMVSFIDRDFVPRYFNITVLKLNPLAIFTPVS